MVFSFVGEAVTRTTIYVDGYNLYHSRLQGTAFEWLDLVGLFRGHVIRAQDPSAVITAVKFFTSPATANYARHGQASEETLTQYLRALKARDPPIFQLIEGFHVFKPTPLPAHVPGRPSGKTDRQRVWKRSPMCSWPWQSAAKPSVATSTRSWPSPTTPTLSPR